MKVVILAGGFGTRISEESHLKPKPMIEIGGKPILWHIMKIYAHYGFTEFIICAGYRQDVVKEFFANYYLHMSDVTFDFSMDNAMKVHSNVAEPWKVTIIDTGYGTMTGGRLKRAGKYLGNETFMLTYGDGVSDVDIPALINTHKDNKTLCTITAVQPAPRFGVLNIENGIVTSFREKVTSETEAWINGGFMVMEPGVLAYIDGDDTFLEHEPMERLAAERLLGTYKHHGFWQPMDTMRDKGHLDTLWQTGTAPWKLWGRD